jgi:hypothetical protein
MFYNVLFMRFTLNHIISGLQLYWDNSVGCFVGRMDDDAGEKEFCRHNV